MQHHPIPGKGKRLRAGVCAYCDRRVFPNSSPEARANPACRATRDHIEPRLVKGNADRDQNLVIACLACNRIKAHYPLEPFMFFLHTHKGTPKFNATEFQRFIYDLTLAGFKMARRVAIEARKSPAPRDARGRFQRVA